MSKCSSYLRFLSLAHVIEEDFRIQKVDLTAQRLLEVLAVASSNGYPLTVTEAMSISNLASPATLHRKLMKLMRAGFVEFRFDGVNQKNKYIYTTIASDKKFYAMGQALKSAIKA